MIDEHSIGYSEEEVERVVDVERNDFDTIENILRPKSMDGYVGQDKVKDNLTKETIMVKEAEIDDYLDMNCR